MENRLHRGLWKECKNLWSNKKIFSVFTVNGTFLLKLEQYGPHDSVNHLNDLENHLPEESFAKSSL